jgi:hypothetical protein
MRTVGELKKAIADLPDYVWVVLKGDGPWSEVSTELGANEPFVVLQHTPLSRPIWRTWKQICGAEGSTGTCQRNADHTGAHSYVTWLKRPPEQP